MNILCFMLGFILCGFIVFLYNFIHVRFQRTGNNGGTKKVQEGAGKDADKEAEAGKDTGYKNHCLFNHDNLLYRFCGCGVGSDCKRHIPAFKPADFYGRRCGFCGCVLLLEE